MPNPWAARIMTLLLLAPVFAASLAATPSNRTLRPMKVEDQFRFVEPSNPVLSPDGRWLLFRAKRSSLKENRSYSEVWIAPSDGAGSARQFLQDGDSSPMWAPSSKAVFFLRTVGAGEHASRELFEQRVEDHVALQRSHFGPGPSGVWQMSSDGTFFLVQRREQTPDAPGAQSDVTFVYEGSNGQTRDYWANLWTYDLKTNALRRITNRRWWINGADLAMNGKVAVVAARPDNERNTIWKTELFAVDLSSGSVRQLTHNKAPELNPQWAPDSRHILFTAVSLAHWENGNGDLWLLDSQTGRLRDVTPDHRGRFVQPVFSRDGQQVFVGSGYGTTRFPVRIAVDTGKFVQLVQTIGNVRVGSWSADRNSFAYIYSDAMTPPDVYVGRLGNTSDRQRRMTDLNPWVRQEIDLGSVRVVHWQSFDHRRIEGLLYVPPSDIAGKYHNPMIVHVACGPGCAWLNSFSIKNQVWSGLGYAQLAPNVRGASNYDDSHMRANKFDIGGGDRRDIMTGVDAMLQQKIADSNRLGIDGWSYGAILAGYTITKTRRFKAAILGAMVSDWISEYGASAGYDMELWYIGGNPWSHPERWRERSSLTYANNVVTPTLLHHGDDDQTDSPFQSMDFFVALRKFGTISRFIRYPNEDHDFEQPEHLLLRDTQDIAWMQRFVRGIRTSTIPW
jgi:dipeptidyl aminopeptidase/acylaminoacyl peptidase